MGCIKQNQEHLFECKRCKLTFEVKSIPKDRICDLCKYALKKQEEGSLERWL